MGHMAVIGEIAGRRRLWTTLGDLRRRDNHCDGIVMFTCIYVTGLFLPYQIVSIRSGPMLTIKTTNKLCYTFEVSHGNDICY